MQIFSTIISCYTYFKNLFKKYLEHGDQLNGLVSFLIAWPMMFVIPLFLLSSLHFSSSSCNMLIKINTKISFIFDNKMTNAFQLYLPENVTQFMSDCIRRSQSFVFDYSTTPLAHRFHLGNSNCSTISTVVFISTNAIPENSENNNL